MSTEVATRLRMFISMSERTAHWALPDGLIRKRCVTTECSITYVVLANALATLRGSDNPANEEIDWLHSRTASAETHIRGLENRLVLRPLLQSSYLPLAADLII